MGVDVAVRAGVVVGVWIVVAVPIAGVGSGFPIVTTLGGLAN
jgi:hypothetical protein